MGFLLYGLAGIISGVIGGMGMGGGTLLIPILTIMFDMEQRNAQGINLLVFIPMALISLIIHCKNKLVNFRIGIPIVISGVVASVCGALLALRLSNEILQKCFGVFLLLVGLWQIIETFINLKKKPVTKKINYKMVFLFKLK